MRCVLYGSPAVANGTLYFGSGDKNLYALGLVPPPPTPPADPQCPSGWTCQDIGNPTPAGSESVSGAAWTITAGGAGVAGATDQFRLIAQTVTGDSQLAAQVSALTTGAAGQAGIMVRQTNTPNSPYYAIFAKPNNTLVVQYRTQFGGATTTLKTVTATLPRYLQIQRTGDLFQVATSPDGSTYTLVPGTNTTIVMPRAALEGVAVSSGTNGTAGTATVNAAAAGTITSTLNPAPSASPCPAGWTCTDIGNPVLAGSESLSNGVWTVQGGGSDIWNASDQFHFIWQPLMADGSVSADVTSQTNTSAWAKAGVMLRASTDPGAAYYAVLVTPGHGIVVQYRTAQGAVTSQIATTGVVPVYLKVARAGNVFTAYTSADGITWTQVSGSVVALSNLSGTLLAGMAVTAHGGALCTVTFQSVTVG